VTVPVVAGVNGLALAGGLELMLVCDLAVADERARLGDQHAAFGLVAGGGGSQRLPRAVGLRRAKELMLLGGWLSATQALDWGLVSEVVPADQLEARTAEVAQRLGNGPTRAYGEIRRLLRDSWTASLPEQLHAETEALARTAATQDTAEANSDRVASVTAHLYCERMELHVPKAEEPNQAIRRSKVKRQTSKVRARVTRPRSNAKGTRARQLKSK